MSETALDTPSESLSADTLSLTGNQDVRNAEELRSKLLAMLQDERPRTIDLTAVETIDAAALQVLLSAKRDIGERLDFVIDQESEVAQWLRCAGAMDVLTAKEWILAAPLEELLPKQ